MRDENNTYCTVVMMITTVNINGGESVATVAIPLPEMVSSVIYPLPYAILCIIIDDFQYVYSWELVEVA